MSKSIKKDSLIRHKKDGTVLRVVELFQDGQGGIYYLRGQIVNSGPQNGRMGFSKGMQVDYYFVNPDVYELLTELGEAIYG